MKTTIILAEDNPRDRDFLIAGLPAYEFIQARDGDEAILEARNFEQPFIVSDIQMPNINGIELAKKIWVDKEKARIVFWSQFSDELYLRALSKIIPSETVYGYVLKTNPIAVIEQAIHAVFFDQQCWIDPIVRKAQSYMLKQNITDAEFEVLIDIALGLTDKAIAERRYLTRRGAQNRLKSLYQKLGVDLDLPDEDQNYLINLRSRAVNICYSRGLLNVDLLRQEEEKLKTWLSKHEQASKSLNP